MQLKTPICTTFVVVKDIIAEREQPKIEFKRL